MLVDTAQGHRSRAVLTYKFPSPHHYHCNDGIVTTVILMRFTGCQTFLSFLSSHATIFYSSQNDSYTYYHYHCYWSRCRLGPNVSDSPSIGVHPRSLMFVSFVNSLNLSQKCRESLANIAQNSEALQCLKADILVGIALGIAAGNTSTSVVEPINGWLNK